MRELIEALPLRPYMRVLEIGCGPGAAARAVCERVGEGHVLAIDRSAAAIKVAKAGSSALIKSGRLVFLKCAIEEFELAEGAARFDLAFAFRVGALDGRHPDLEKKALVRIKASLKPTGRLFIDGGSPLKELKIM